MWRSLLSPHAGDLVVLEGPVDVLDHAADEREEKRDRAVGHLLDAVVGHVADPDAPARGGVRERLL